MTQPLSWRLKTGRRRRKNNERIRESARTVFGSMSPTHIFRSLSARRVWPSVRASGLFYYISRGATDDDDTAEYHIQLMRGHWSMIPSRRWRYRWRFVMTKTWFTGWVFIELGIRTSAAPDQQKLQRFIFQQRVTLTGSPDANAVGRDARGKSRENISPLIFFIRRNPPPAESNQRNND